MEISNEKDPLGFYRVLQLNVKATSHQIRLAYIRRIRETHPDTGENPNVDDFIKVRKAYEILYDEKSRKQYDEQGTIVEDSRFETSVIYQRLGIIFNNVLAKALTVDSLDFTQFNIIYSMVRSIEEAQDGFESQLDNHRTVMDQLLKLRRRIKRDKDEVNIFVNVLNEKIKDREKKIEELHFEIKMADHLLEELNLYSSEAELVRAWQSHSTNMWSSNTSSSSTNSTLHNVRVVYNQEM